jgi:hypothetical protein
LLYLLNSFKGHLITFQTEPPLGGVGGIVASTAAFQIEPCHSFTAVLSSFYLDIFINLLLNRSHDKRHLGCFNLLPP